MLTCDSKKSGAKRASLSNTMSHALQRLAWGKGQQILIVVFVAAKYVIFVKLSPKPTMAGSPVRVLGKRVINFINTLCHLFAGICKVFQIRDKVQSLPSKHYEEVSTNSAWWPREAINLGFWLKLSATFVVTLTEYHYCQEAATSAPGEKRFWLVSYCQGGEWAIWADSVALFTAERLFLVVETQWQNMCLTSNLQVFQERNFASFY